MKIGEFLKRHKNQIDIDSDQKYKRVTIRTNNKGISLRDSEFGSNIGTKKQFFIKKGQFLLSKIDARNGAFGIVPEELDEAIITGNFWAYDIDSTKVHINWLNLFVSLPFFIEVCSDASSGTTNRRYLDEDKFLNYEIDVPDISEQEKSLSNYKNFKSGYDIFYNSVKSQGDLIKAIREAILQEAVQGKLVPQDPKDEPVSELLKRIKAEKEKLIKEGKIKKEKPLPPITPEEIPFKLPKGWEYERLGNLATKITKGATPTTYGFDYLESGVRFVKVENVIDGVIDNNSITGYISEEANSFMSRSILEENDVLFSIAGSIGKTCIVSEHNLPANTNQALAIIRGTQIIFLPKFLKMLLDSQVSKKTRDLARGGAMNNVSLTDIKNMVVFIPPLNEQKRIVLKVNELISFCEELQQKVQSSKKDSENLMQAVLQKTFLNKA